MSTKLLYGRDEQGTAALVEYLDAVRLGQAQVSHILLAALAVILLLTRQGYCFHGVFAVNQYRVRAVEARHGYSLKGGVPFAVVEVGFGSSPSEVGCLVAVTAIAIIEDDGCKGRGEGVGVHVFPVGLVRSLSSGFTRPSLVVAIVVISIRFNSRPVGDVHEVEGGAVHGSGSGGCCFRVDDDSGKEEASFGSFRLHDIYLFYFACRFPYLILEDQFTGREGISRAIDREAVNTLRSAIHSGTEDDRVHFGRSGKGELQLTSGRRRAQFQVGEDRVSCCCVFVLTSCIHVCTNSHCIHILLTCLIEDGIDCIQFGTTISIRFIIIGKGQCDGIVIFFRGSGVGDVEVEVISLVVTAGVLCTDNDTQFAYLREVSVRDIEEGLDVHADGVLASAGTGHLEFVVEGCISIVSLARSPFGSVGSAKSLSSSSLKPCMDKALRLPVGEIGARTIIGEGHRLSRVNGSGSSRDCTSLIGPSHCYYGREGE